MQRNWIGRSYGVEFTLPYAEETARRMDDGKQGLKVFTTRADTIMGITFAAVAAEHPLATEAAKGNAALAAFIEECKKGGVQEAELATMEKKGMRTGLLVLHPFTKEEVEVWVGNYVLMGYGEGAVMAVPGHDERDFAFAKKYGLPIKQVIDVGGQAYSTDAWQPWYEAPGAQRELRASTTASSSRPPIDAVAADLEAAGPGREAHAVPPARLGHLAPALLGHADPDHPVPEVRRRARARRPAPRGAARGPRARRQRQPAREVARVLRDARARSAAAPAKRETDTLDTFVDSSWYFLRYACPGAKTMVDARADYWMPMDQYIGGIEHAILHLLYARFWTKAMRDMGLVKIDEPFQNLLTQGMVLNHIFSRRTDKGGIEYFAPDEVDVTADAEGKITGATLKADGKPVDYDGIGTMSKSKRNGVDPQDMIDRYGADTARFYVM